MVSPHFVKMKKSDKAYRSFYQVCSFSIQSHRSTNAPPSYKCAGRAFKFDWLSIHGSSKLRHRYAYLWTASIVATQNFSGSSQCTYTNEWINQIPEIKSNWWKRAQSDSISINLINLTWRFSVTCFSIFRSISTLARSIIHFACGQENHTICKLGKNS